MQTTTDAAKLKEAKTQLAAALDYYRHALALDPSMLSAELGYAWCLEQAGKKTEAIAEYRKTIDQGWKKEKAMTRANLGWHSIVAEAAGYLKPLLNPDKDGKEIAELDRRAKQAAAIPRPVTPIAVALEPGATAAEIEDHAARVRFDADGSGLPKQWSWITPRAAWLVYDSDGTGRVESALQMFGNVTFWCFWDDGYAALRALDDDGDGRLTGRELDHLALWHDANGNGRVDPGEVRALSAYGIVAVCCRGEVDRRDPDRQLHAAAGVTFADGRTRATYDIVLASRSHRTARREAIKRDAKRQQKWATASRRYSTCRFCRISLTRLSSVTSLFCAPPTRTYSSSPPKATYSL